MDTAMKADPTGRATLTLGILIALCLAQTSGCMYFGTRLGEAGPMQQFGFAHPIPVTPDSALYVSASIAGATSADPLDVATTRSTSVSELSLGWNVTLSGDSASTCQWNVPVESHYTYAGMGLSLINVVDNVERGYPSTAYFDSHEYDDSSATTPGVYANCGVWGRSGFLVYGLEARATLAPGVTINDRSIDPSGLSLNLVLGYVDGSLWSALDGACDFLNLLGSLFRS